MDQNQRSWQASPSPSRSSYRRELTCVVLCKKETGASNLHHSCCVTPKRVVSLHAGLLLALLRLWVARLLFMNDFTNFLWEPEVATFRTKPLISSRLYLLIGWQKLNRGGLLVDNIIVNHQRWSPRGRPREHILKPQVLENCPVLGSRKALFLNRWNFVGKRQKPCGKSAKNFFWFPQVHIAWKKIFEDLFCLKKFFEDLIFEIAWKKILKTFFFWRTLASVSLALVSRGSVLGLGLEIFLCPWLWPRALCPRIHLC